MINNDRIVPIQKCDYLSMIGTILTLNGTSFVVAKSSTVEGNFTLSGGSTFLCNQPAKVVDFGALTSGTVYFVADYGFEKVKAGATEASTGVKKNGITLYKAVLADTAITITAVTPEVV